MSTYLRHRQIRRADDTTDQENSAGITGAVSSSTTQEDYQRFFLSRLRQVIFGDATGTHWFDDFLTQEILSLRELTYYDLLSNEVLTTGVTYSNTVTGGKVTQEKWVNTGNSRTIRQVDYTYLGTKVTTEVRKVFSPADGTTVIAQATINYSYSGNTLTGETITRDV